MTVKDWLRESQTRFRNQPLAKATRTTTDELFKGVGRRVIDSFLSDSVWDREWDVLIVLDATRVDLMKEVSPEFGEIPDEIDSRWSEASCSLDWIKRVFSDEYRNQALSAGYITANPFSGHEAQDTKSVDLQEGTDVGYLDEVWRDGWQNVGKGIETVPPEIVTDRSISAWRRREDLGINRLIVHYMQPHQPFRSRPEWTGAGSHLANLMEPGRDAEFCIWEETRCGKFDPEVVWEAYKENLSWVLTDVTTRLLRNCNARIALTADHGNGMGEWGVWGHPPGEISPAVRKVPWIQIDGLDNETISGSTRTIGKEMTDLDDKLKALGYK